MDKEHIGEPIYFILYMYFHKANDLKNYRFMLYHAFKMLKRDEYTVEICYMLTNRDILRHSKVAQINLIFYVRISVRLDLFLVKIVHRVLSNSFQHLKKLMKH